MASHAYPTVHQSLPPETVQTAMPHLEGMDHHQDSITTMTDSFVESQQPTFPDPIGPHNALIHAEELMVPVFILRSDPTDFDQMPVFSSFDDDDRPDDFPAIINTASETAKQVISSSLFPAVRQRREQVIRHAIEQAADNAVIGILKSPRTLCLYQD